MITNTNKGQFRQTILVSALLLAAGCCCKNFTASHSGLQTTMGYNGEGQDSAAFAFTNIPAPSKNDAATDAKFSLISGKNDFSGGGLDKLHDGQIPSEADEPGENFFFSTRSVGGRLQVDLGKARELTQVNTYSWHTDSRAPQVYKLYASEGTASSFVTSPAQGTDPAKSGWKFIANVDTTSPNHPAGGQYGVSISSSKGTIGTYRYFLFDVAPSETNDAFGNTFFSEIDIVEKNAPAAPAAAATPFVIKSTDGYCTISIDSTKAPELKDWAEQTLGPALAGWYPKITAYMASEGYSAPKKFSISLHPGDGVAATSGTHVWANSTWLDKELKGEAVGALIHEVVHVVQQYGDGRDGHHTPGWIVEGIPDYIRFFKCEPELHGADASWIKSRRNISLNYDKLYRISANFLNYVVINYDTDKDLIAKVNGACRKGTYTDDLWKQLTGKTLPELNDEWKASVAKEIAPKQS